MANLENSASSRIDFRSAVERSKAGIAHISLDGRYLHVNSSFCELVGYTPEQIEQMHAHELVHPDDVEALTKVLHASFSEGDHAPRSLNRYLTRDGSLIQAEMSISLVRDGNGEPEYLIAVVDPEKQDSTIEKALAEHEEILRATFDQAAIGIAHVGPDGRFIRVNKAFIQLTGYSADELSRLRILDIAYPADRSIGLDEFRRTMRGELQQFTIEKRYLRRDGSIIWVRITSAPVRNLETGETRFNVAIIEDITDRKRAELALQESRTRYQKIVNQAATGVVQADTNGAITLVNQKFCAMLGYEESELLGKNIIEITAPGGVSGTLAAVRTLAAGGPDFIIEKQCLRKDGSAIWTTSSISAFRDATGEFQGLVAIVVDITERKLAEDRIRHAALHDPLTGLPNRAMLFEYANHLLAHCRRTQQRAAVLFMDLDRFKPINDTHGHEVGDAVLVQVASRLMSGLRAEDVVIRLGGDEFVVLLQDIRSASYAAEVARHIARNINQPFIVGEMRLSVSTSIGISLFPNDAQDIDMLISHADSAMYQAKQAGRDNFQFYSPECSAGTKLILAIEQQLKSALSDNTFHLCYQPVFDVETGNIVNVEALLRWEDKEIGPDRFVPVAESSGIINPIGRWLLKEASIQYKSWVAHGLPAIPIAVNVSVVEFRDRDFVSRFTGMAREHGIALNALQLELTETAVMDDIDRAVAVLSELQALGVTILLDDFGTGYSSLAYLARLPLNKVKIDKSFISRLESDVACRAITDAMIALGRTLNLEVVAEGIESRSALDYIFSQGCRQAQGFYLAEPMPGMEFENWFHAYHQGRHESGDQLHPRHGLH